MRSQPLFLSIATLPRAAVRSRTNQIRWACSHVQNKSYTARERRRALEQARVAAHLELKKEIDARRLSSENVCTVYISIPPFVRKRCGLTNRLARVKTVMERHEILDIASVRRNIAVVLCKLFPELEANGLLRHEDDFDVKVGGRDVSYSDSLTESVKLCEDVGSSLFLEVIPHNLPPEKPPLSDRWRNVREKATRTTEDSSGQFRMVSFFKFTPIADPPLTSSLLKKFWGTLGIVGRIYVAKEGINAQMAVPEETWIDFLDAMNGKWIERGRTVVPDCIMGVFLNEDGIVQRAERPFDALHVRARDKVLSDGLPAALDWDQAGRELSPEEWHDVLKSRPQDAILVDCRNKYETDVGHFEDAEKPNTGTFRDTWQWLENRLKNVKKDTPIMTYCTGGIRCVKVNAYLEQEMGFTNTTRLAGGIVSYARSLEEKGKIEESQFRGINHVFDGRVGRTVTVDELSRCLNCGQPCSVQTDCAYVGCSRPFETRMFIQCPECAAELRGACSKECCAAITKSRPTAEQFAQSGGQEFVSTNPVYRRNKDKNSVYSECFSMDESEILRELRETTENLFPSRSHMLSGPMQGAFLAMLVKLANCTRVLELGTFTGYSAVYMAQALPEHGLLVSCETDEEVLGVAREFVNKSKVISASVDLLNLPAMTVLEKCAKQDSEPFDMVFVDANKGGYKEYYDFMLVNDIVRRGGLMVFDNVLFKGLVARDWQNSKNDMAQNNIMDFSEEEKIMIRSRQRSIRKAHNIARKLHEFNEFVHSDMRSEQVLLPVRDGLLVVRRK